MGKDVRVVLLNYLWNIYLHFVNCGGEVLKLSQVHIKSQKVKSLVYHVQIKCKAIEPGVSRTSLETLYTVRLSLQVFWSQRLKFF